MTQSNPTDPCYLVTLNGSVLTEGVDYRVDAHEILLHPSLDIDDEDTVVAYEVLRKRVVREP